MKRGICKMCLLEKDLFSSHLMPAGVYEYCRNEGISPIRVGDGDVVSTDRQVQEELLCPECEDILNKGGEQWVIPKLASANPKTFPLYDLLSRKPVLHKSDAMTIFPAKNNPEIDVQKLAHFAIGIFWKASVHPWRADKVAPQIDLGSYSDGLRKWLRGEGEFPDGVVLNVFTFEPERAQIAFVDPWKRFSNKPDIFWLHVPGLLFILDVEPETPALLRAPGFLNNPENPIVISTHMSNNVERLLATHFRGSRKTKSYASAKAKRAQSRTDKQSSKE